MGRLRALAVLLTVVALGMVSGCSSSSPSAAPTTSKPAVCTSVQQLKASVAKLTNLSVGANTLDTLRTNLADVQRQLQAVSQDATNQYSGDVAKVRTAASGVQAAATAAQKDASAANLGLLVTSVKSLGSEVTTLANAVSSTC